MRPEHDFKGGQIKADDWAEKVFLAASHFRLHKYYGNGGQDRAQVKTFAEAKAMAEEALKVTGHRVLIYAVTPSGRSASIPPSKWGQYLALCQR